jgi:hypothetical protein
MEKAIHPGSAGGLTELDISENIGKPLYREPLKAKIKSLD